MHQLYPIIRRKRRPLIQPDVPPAIVVPVTEPVAEPEAQPPKITQPKKSRDDAPKV